VTIVTARKPHSSRARRIRAGITPVETIVRPPTVSIDHDEVLRRADKADEVWRELVRRASLKMS
jgi:hypothetical protein